ncbi:MAG: glycerol-3-phosphate acyltransferase [Acidimicrobiia bacterium]|nr:glycerol-3-phosphate acyltransferase [Acidimicrobiia bacterium]
MDSSALTVIAVAIVGYLAGSLSGARIIGKRRGAGDLSTTRVVLDGTGSTVETHGVSPSSLQARGGGRAGLPAGAIDIAKALMPTLVAAVLWPDSPEAVFAAAGALVGHIYPVYHGFLGGYGISPLLGALVVLDFRAPLFAIAVFAVLGLILGSAFIGIEMWTLALIPYFVWQGDAWTIGFAVLANLLYFWRSWDETVAALKSWSRDPRPWPDRVGDFKKYPDYEVPNA